MGMKLAFRFALFLFLSLAAAVLSGCSMSANVFDIASETTVVQQKIYFDVTTLNIAEGSAAIVSVQLSDKKTEDTLVKLSGFGDSSLFESIPASVIIPAGSLSTSLRIQTVDDLIFKGVNIFRLVLSADDASLVAESNSLTLNIADNDLPTLVFGSSSATVSEDVTNVSIFVQINGVAPNSVTVPLNLSGTATIGAGDDFTTSSTTLSIPAGSTQGMLTVTVNDDAAYEGSETLIVSMGAPTGAILGTPNIFTLTIADNDLGNFNITGITGGTDVTADDFLLNGVLATVNWSASTGATSYDVTLYASDGVTVVCPTQNTVSTNYNFSSCTLTAGANYKAKVVAKLLGISQLAANSMYAFNINQSPIANNDGAVRIMKNAAAVTLQVVTATDSATRGTVADSDPDVGDTISITAITQGTSGGVVTNTSSTVTYTVPSATFTGTDSFTYTLSDNHGLTAVGTVTMHVMDTYTWTGKSSSNWNSNGNWCGTITNNVCNGTTGFPSNSATATHVAIFDGTCSGTGHTCNALINVSSQAYALNLKSGYTGTLTQSAGQTILVGNGGYTQSAGTMLAGNSNFTVQGAYNLVGGVFTGSSGNLRLDSPYYGATTNTYTIFNVGASATFTAPQGLYVLQSSYSCQTLTLQLNVPSTLNISDLNINVPHGGCTETKVELVSGDTIIINGNLTHSDGVLFGNYHLKGNITVGSGADGGHGTITMNGATNQTYSATATGATGQLVINKAAGTVTDAGTGYLTVKGFSLQQGSFTSPATQFNLDVLYFGANTSTVTSFNVASGTVFTPPQLFNMTQSGSSCQNITVVLNVPGTLTFNNFIVNIVNSGCNVSKIQTDTGDSIIVDGYFNHSDGVLNGNWQIKGNLTVGGGADQGTAAMTFNGSSAQTISTTGPLPTGLMTINNPGNTITLLTNVSMNAVGQTLNVTAGSIDMNGRNLTVKALTLNTMTVTKNTGVLTVNSVVAGTGPLFGGTVDP